MKKKNVVIVGYGGQGGWHADHAAKSDVVALRGIYDIKEERMELARSKGIFTYGSLDEICADADAEIVVVATPNDVHKEIVCALLRSGHHVVCEKPVEMTVAAFDEMARTAAESGKLFTVHQNRRWDVDYLAIKDIIESDRIGEPISIESRIHGSRGIPSDWRCHKPYGGGMMLDWGVHLIDQMLQLIPERIRRVYCEMTNITTDEVDDGFKLLLTYESGKRALIEVGTFNFLPLPRFYMQSKKGTAIIQDWRQNAHVALCKAWHESDVVPVQTAAGITKTMAPRDGMTLDEFDWTRPTSDVHDYYRNLVRAIDGEEEIIVKLPEVRRVMRVMETAFASNEAGQAIILADSDLI
jgi:predicted dehydrogenase